MGGLCVWGGVVSLTGVLFFVLDWRTQGTRSEPPRKNEGGQPEQNN